MKKFTVWSAYEKEYDSGVRVVSTCYAKNAFEAKNIAKGRHPDMFVYCYREGSEKIKLNLRNGPWVDVPIEKQTGLLLEFSCNHQLCNNTSDQEENGMPESNEDDLHYVSSHSLYLAAHFQSTHGISVVKIQGAGWKAYIADENGVRLHEQDGDDPFEPVLRCALQCEGGNDRIPLALLWYERERLAKLQIDS